MEAAVVKAAAAACSWCISNVWLAAAVMTIPSNAQPRLMPSVAETPSADCLQPRRMREHAATEGVLFSSSFVGRSVGLYRRVLSIFDPGHRIFHRFPRSESRSFLSVRRSAAIIWSVTVGRSDVRLFNRTVGRSVSRSVTYGLVTLAIRCVCGPPFG